MAMAKELVHDFKSVRHKTLAGMAQEVLAGKPVAARLRDEAETLHHDKALEKEVHDGELVESQTGESAQKKTQTRKESVLGRIFLFVPTGERVTVTRELVGKSYQGDPIHEVTARDGHIFLASLKQLRTVV